MRKRGRNHDSDVTPSSKDAPANDGNGANDTPVHNATAGSHTEPSHGEKREQIHDLDLMRASGEAHASGINAGSAYDGNAGDTESQIPYPDLTPAARGKITKVLSGAMGVPGCRRDEKKRGRNGEGDDLDASSTFPLPPAGEVLWQIPKNAEGHDDRDLETRMESDKKHSRHLEVEKARRRKIKGEIRADKDPNEVHPP